MTPMITTGIYESWMRRLEAVCRAMGSTLRILDYKKPYQVEAQSPLLKIAREEMRGMGRTDVLATQSSTNEASLFSRVGIECISFGPGRREGNIHTPQEHVLIEDLKTAIEFYKRMLGRICL
jgi:succinyl-diaminopimelate desuccinylase